MKLFVHWICLNIVITIFLSKVHLCVYDLNELTEVEISAVMCVYISAYGFKM